jgi:hypothetical protein
MHESRASQQLRRDVPTQDGTAGDFYLRRHRHNAPCVEAEEGSLLERAYDNACNRGLVES